MSGAVANDQATNNLTKMHCVQHGYYTHEKKKENGTTIIQIEKQISIGLII